MAETLTRIRRGGAVQEDHHYFDVRIQAELGDDEPRRLKMFALPLDLACLMPILWDRIPSRDQAEPAAHFRVAERIDKGDPDLREASLMDFRPLGEQSESVDYHSVSRPLRRHLSPAQEDDLRPQDEDGPLRLHPLKLLLLAREFEDTMLDDPMAQDLFDLVFDKIALAALLPLILSPSVWPEDGDDELAAVLAADAPGRALDELLRKALATHEPLERPRNGLLTGDRHAIELKPELWHELLTYLAGPDREHPVRVLLPLDDLDDLLSEHLEGLVPQLLKDHPEVETGWRQLLQDLDERPQAWGDRRADYGFFYPLMDLFFEQRRRDLRLLKVPYQHEAPDLPFVEQIDLRPTVWAREATAITTEMRIAASRYQLAKGRLEKLQGGEAPGDDFEPLADELRRASRLWFDARKRFDLLSQQVADEGWELTLRKPADGPSDVAPDTFYTLTQKVVKERRTVVRRRRSFWSEVGYRVRRCRTVRVLFFRKKRCWWEYRRRRQLRWQTWYETVITHHETIQPVEVDQDPVATYLARSVAKDAFPSPEDARRYAQALGKSEEVKLDEKGRYYLGLRNRDKQVHVFRYVDGDYRDQHGLLLDTLLDQADPPVGQRTPALDDALEPIAPRRRLLLLIPVLEQRIDGSVETVAYRAVHNPVKGRGASAAPRLYLQETYRATLGQEPGHWLGALAHSISLFPGESRRFKLTTEQRIETEQSREGLTSQKTSNERRINVRDQVRSELERENRSASSSHWNASASGGGSFGLFSAKASAGGGGKSSRSSRRLARQLNDRVGEVMGAASSSNEVQLKTVATTSESRSSVAEQVIEFSNVNQGRSVNYKFFQVMHCYRSQVALHDLRLVVESSDELIPGLDMVRTRSYRMDQLEELLPELIEEERRTIRQRLEAFIRERHRARQVVLDGGETLDVTFLRERDGELVGVDSTNLLEARSWHINSGAFFVETEVSDETATEPYVEQAREAEISLQQASAVRLRAESEALRAGHPVIPSNVDRLVLHLGDTESQEQTRGTEPT